MFDKFRPIFPVSDEVWNDCVRRFERIEIPAKTILLKEGEISKKLFLIEKGCLRVWFNNDGKDVSFQFFFEHEMVSSLESFRNSVASPVYIETLEPSVLWSLQKKDADAILAIVYELPSLREKFLDAVFDRTFIYMKHYLSFIKDSPAERYLHLIEQKPQVVQRIPQHYIASYLGISSVHLSRIKSKLAKNTGR